MELKLRFWNTETKMMYCDTGLTSLGVNDALELARSNNYIPLLSTGLKDSEGTEIYKGDILISEPYHHKFEDRCDILDVKWNSTNASFELSGDEPYDMCEVAALRVIGNIYENPELVR